MSPTIKSGRLLSARVLGVVGAGLIIVGLVRVRADSVASRNLIQAGTALIMFAVLLYITRSRSSR
jgi:hypothetical protein